MKKRKFAAAACVACLASLFYACGDDDVAGGVTDIGNSIAMGTVKDAGGRPVAKARVVAYSDSWEERSIADSVETFTAADGSFKLSIDSSTAYVLYAELDSICGLAELASDSRENANILVGGKKALQGTLLGVDSGYVRIVGTNLKTNVASDGAFAFDSLPPGHIEISYATNDSAIAHFAFDASVKDSLISLPPLEKLDKNNGLLTFKNDVEEQSKFTYRQVKISARYAEAKNILLPVTIETRTFADSSICILKDGVPQPFDIENWGKDSALVWVQMNSLKQEETLTITDSICKAPGFKNITANLHLNGTEAVYNNDSTKAEAKHVQGKFGDALELAQGQYIDLGELDPCAGDFTISLWVKWYGPNGHHQILVSERAYWSDSTSRFQWHFEMEGEFMVLKSMPHIPEGFSFGDSTIVPVNEWAHLALVSKGNQISMYVNGKQVGETREFIPNDLTQTVPLRIGGDEIIDETWNGLIDEVRIENTAREDILHTFNTLSTLRSTL